VNTHTQRLAAGQRLPPLPALQKLQPHKLDDAPCAPRIVGLPRLETNLGPRPPCERRTIGLRPMISRGITGLEIMGLILCISIGLKVLALLEKPAKTPTKEAVSQNTRPRMRAREGTERQKR